VVSENAGSSRGLLGALIESRHSAREPTRHIWIPIKPAQFEHALPGVVCLHSRSIAFRLGDVLPDIGHFHRPVFARFECLLESGFQHAIGQILESLIPQSLINADSRNVELLSGVEREFNDPLPN